MPRDAGSDHSACQAAYSAMYEQAVGIMDNPPGIGTQRDLFEHRLGTMGHAYTAMGYAELYAENEALRSALDGIRVTAGAAWQQNCGAESFGDIATLAEIALANGQGTSDEKGQTS